MSGKERDVVCPSGMRGVIRPLKVSEERLYRNAQAIKNNRVIPQFISHGWERLTDPGPYTFEDKVVWDKVLMGDAMFLLMQVRAATYTNEYPIVVPCQGCNKPIEHTIDVLKDMRIQEMPDEAVSHVKTGDLLYTEYEGKQLGFKLLRLGDDKRISRVEEMRKLSRTQASLAVRLVDVEGVEDKGAFAIVNWVENLDAGQPDEIIDILDEYDCGIDTEIKLMCDSCLYEQEITLPLEASFFRRPSRKKEMRRARQRDQMGEVS